MAAFARGKQNILTKDTGDVAVEIINGANKMDVTAGQAHVRLYDSAGNGITVSGGGMDVNIAAQSLAGVKISRDGTAPSAAKGSYVELCTGDAVLAVDNPVPMRLSDGTNFNAVTAPAYVELVEGGAQLSAVNPVAMRLTDGAAFNAQGNPVYAAVSKDTAANAYNNAIWNQLSDGASSNPLGSTSNPLVILDSGAAAPGTPKKIPSASILTTGIAAGATANVDYEVTAGKTLKLYKIKVAAQESMHFELIRDALGTPASIMYLAVGPGSPSDVYEFTFPEEFAAATTFRVQATNDGEVTSPAAVYWEATED